MNLLISGSLTLAILIIFGLPDFFLISLFYTGRRFTPGHGVLQAIFNLFILLFFA